MAQLVAAKVSRHVENARSAHVSRKRQEANHQSALPPAAPSRPSRLEPVTALLFCSIPPDLRIGLDTNRDLYNAFFESLGDWSKRLKNATPSELELIEAWPAKSRAPQGSRGARTQLRNHLVRVVLSSADVEAIKRTVSAYQLDVLIEGNGYFVPFGSNPHTYRGEPTVKLTVSCRT